MDSNRHPHAYSCRMQDNQSHFPAVAQAQSERRILPRTATTGEVILRPYDRSLVQGEMLDVSLNGFRIKYVGKRMRVGAEVEVIHPWTNLKATIAWTIRSGDWIHAGLQIVQEGAEIVAEA